MEASIAAAAPPPRARPALPLQRGRARTPGSRARRGPPPLAGGRAQRREARRCWPPAPPAPALRCGRGAPSKGAPPARRARAPLRCPPAARGRARRRRAGGHRAAERRAAGTGPGRWRPVRASKTPRACWLCGARRRKGVPDRGVGVRSGRARNYMLQKSATHPSEWAPAAGGSAPGVKEPSGRGDAHMARPRRPHGIRSFGGPTYAPPQRPRPGLRHCCAALRGPRVLSPASGGSPPGRPPGTPPAPEAAPTARAAMSSVYWVAGAAVGIAEGAKYALVELCPCGAQLARLAGLQPKQVRRRGAHGPPARPRGSEGRQGRPPARLGAADGAGAAGGTTARARRASAAAQPRALPARPSPVPTPGPGRDARRRGGHAARRGGRRVQQLPRRRRRRGPRPAVDGRRHRSRCTRARGAPHGVPTGFHRCGPRRHCHC
jgi:hypothetical protein